MHKILNRTHRAENIDLLKARDYYFQKARVANNKVRNICLLAPILLTVGGMILGSVFNFSDDDNWLDVIVGITAIIAFIADIFVQRYINVEMDRSNTLREEYDVRVLGIKRNLFFGNNSDEGIRELVKVSEFVPDGGKYEVWYRETFSDDDTSNAIAMCMDNTIYTYHVYSAYATLIRNRLCMVAAFFVLYTAWYMLTPDDYFVTMVNPFMLFIALFDWIKELVGSFIVSEEQIGSAGNVIDYVKSNKDQILSDYESKETILRSIEDIVYSNRAQSLFIPKVIRDKFLKNTCVYYRDLDEIKSLYWKDNVTKPEKPEDYEIPAAVTGAPESFGKISGTEVVNMRQIHDALLSMLDDVRSALDEKNIRYMLDGGTLIGAMRKSNNGSFLAWDDDVDLSLESDTVEEAIEAIRAKFGDKYEIQDYDSEKYYSPRLSRFRVRMKNSESFIDEKDSELFELYESRGLFLDVYAYSPILVNKSIDSLYRKIFIHPLHKKIRLAEKEWKTNGKRPKDLKKFNALKEKYMDRAKRYHDYAKCRDYYAYEPHYIEDLKNPGPYIRKEDLYGKEGSEKNFASFENRRFEVPVNPEAVLSAFYGKDWERSPYVPISELRKPKEGSSDAFNIHMYSEDTFDSSKYKHVKSVYIKGKTYQVEK